MPAPFLALTFSAVAIALFLFLNELWATSTGKPSTLRRDVSEQMVVNAVRKSPPNSATPKSVATFNETRSSDGLLLWLRAAYPGLDVSSLEWRKAALAFMETRDRRSDARVQIVPIIARALEASSQ